MIIDVKNHKFPEDEWPALAVLCRYAQVDTNIYRDKLIKKI